MPAKVRKRGDKYRVVEERDNRTVLVRRKGTPIDGGGHASKSKAVRQARAVNARK